jgi:hypothetical protein
MSASGFKTAMIPVSHYVAEVPILLQKSVADMVDL